MIKPYYETSLGKLYHGDCLEIMPELPKVDLVVTSPPFNLNINYGDIVDDNKSNEDYHLFAIETLKKLFPVIQNGGRVCFEIGGSGRNFPMSWWWQDAAYKGGFKLFSEITLSHRKTNACAWGSWMKPDNVYTIPNFHMLYVFFKETATKVGDKTDIARNEFIEWTRGRWSISWASHKLHPAPFSTELPYRCVRLFGHCNDLILDPFMGSGTTAVLCERLSRRWICIDLEEKNCEIAAKRIETEASQLKLFR